MVVPKLKGVVHLLGLPLGVRWRSRLDVGRMDPSGDALDLSRRGQEHQVRSFAVRLKVGYLMSPHVHGVPDLELVRHLQVSRLVGLSKPRLRPHFPLHSLKGFQPGI